MKHSKLFLTGMAALLLSFGLMMTGCDSGGDSDSGPTINAADYITIEETTAGADGTAAVYTVTVKQSVPATNKAVFTNVADAAVEYIGGTGDKVAQAAAIKTALNDAAGTLYDAAVGTTPGTDDHIITLTALANGVKTKPEVKVENYTAPVTNDVTGETAANVTAGDTALAVTATGGELKTGLKVFISTDGATVTITTATSVDGAIATGSTATVAQEGLKIIVKGLTAAAGTPNNTSGTPKLKSSAKTAIVIKGDAQATQVTSVAAKTGVPVVLQDQAAYEFVSIAAAGAANIVFATNPLSLNINNADIPIDADIDAELIGYLTALKAVLTSASVGTFKVAGGAGAITEIETVAAATVPAGTTLFVPGAALKLKEGVDFTVHADGSVKVGTATDNVTFKGVVIGPVAVALVTGADGKFDLGDGSSSAFHVLTVKNGGSIKTAGTGKVAAVFTEITGEWAVEGGATDITITVTGSGVTTLTGTAANSALTAKAAGSKITQKIGSNNSLTLAATTTIDLKGVAGSPVGAIVLNPGTNPGTLSPPSSTDTSIKTGNSGTISFTPTANTAGIVITSTAENKLLVSGNNHLTIKTTDSTPKKLVSMTNTSNTITLKAHTSTGDAVSIDADLILE